MDIHFKTYSLLESKDGEITGPMSPVMFANEFASQINLEFTGLARLSFEDDEIHNVYEDGFKRGLTGYDTLLIGRRYKNNKFIAMAIDMGVSGVPVAFSYYKERQPVLSAAYQKAKFEKYLTEADIKAILDYCHDNYEQVFEIKNFTKQKI
jgi:integrase